MFTVLSGLLTRTLNLICHTKCYVNIEFLLSSLPTFTELLVEARIINKWMNETKRQHQTKWPPKSTVGRENMNGHVDHHLRPSFERSSFEKETTVTWNIIYIYDHVIKNKITDVVWVLGLVTILPGVRRLLRKLGQSIRPEDQWAILKCQCLEFGSSSVEEC